MSSPAATNQIAWHSPAQPTGDTKRPFRQPTNGLELRQVAGLNAGNRFPLGVGSFSPPATPGMATPFALRIRDDGAVTVVPGPNGVYLDTELISGPSPLEDRVINVGYARFRVGPSRSTRRSRTEIVRGETPQITDPVIPATVHTYGGPDQFITRLLAARTLLADQRRAQHLDPEEIAWRAGEGQNLHWTRRKDHWNIGQVCIASADLPWQPRVDQPWDLSDYNRGLLNALSVLPSVPVTADLNVGPLGITGPRPAVLACARQLIATLATVSPPSETSLTILADPDLRSDWSWVQNLPHTRSNPASARGTDAQPLVLIDRAEQRHDTSLALSFGGRGGANVIMLAESAHELPPICAAVLDLAPDNAASVLNYRDGWTVQQATPNGISELLASQIADNLAARSESSS